MNAINFVTRLRVQQREPLGVDASVFADSCFHVVHGWGGGWDRDICVVNIGIDERAVEGPRSLIVIHEGAFGCWCFACWFGF